MHGHETPWHRRNQIGFRHRRKCRGKIRHGERDATGETLLLQCGIDDAERVRGDRHHQMLALAETLQGRPHSERMTGARHRDEILVVDGAGREARWRAIDRRDSDIDRPCFQLVEYRRPCPLDGMAALRRHQLSQPDVNSG